MRAPASLLLLLLTCLTLAACGSDDDTTTATTTAAATAGAFPVTLDGALGATTVERAPERVVALDFNSADALLALGVTPVAIARVDYAPGGVQPWTRAALRGARPELLETATGYPLERIAALRPDLIVASNAYGADRVADQLSALAPLLAWSRTLGAETWQETTRRVGAALGRTREASALIDSVERQIDDARGGHPELDGATISIFNAVGGQLYAINDPADFSIRFAADLGMRLSPALERLEGQEGRAALSAERVDLVDADVVVGTSPSPAELRRATASPLFRRLPAVRRGSYVELPLSPATAIAFPSALSIPYALETLVPRLSAAARAR
jgi:iron complex transport system substrate-binding protein